jgi:hypothetical protein
MMALQAVMSFIPYFILIFFMIDKHVNIYTPSCIIIIINNIVTIRKTSHSINTVDFNIFGSLHEITQRRKK